MMDWAFFAFAVASTVALTAGGVLLIAGYIGTLPAALSQGWRVGLPVLLLPLVGPTWFAYNQGKDFRRPMFQLLGGGLLLIVAGVLILGLGPHFAAKLAVEAMEAAKNR